jgi:hypothetical protein
MTKNTQLKIRIRLDQSVPDHHSLEQEGDLAILPESSAVSYDWRKIFLAILLLLLVLAAISWVVSTWLTADGEPQALPGNVVSLPKTPVELEREGAVVAKPVLPGVPSKKTSENRLVDAEQSVRGPDISTELTLATGLETLIEPALKPRPEIKPEPRILQEIDEMGAVAPSKPGHLNVVRAQLTSGIQQREPVDNIDQISLAQKASRPIFFFLHLQGFKNEKVIVEWFYQDKRIAKVTLQTGGDDWRTYSSKMLNKARLGLWRVVAIDQSGNLLAERSFKVSR